VTEPPSSSAECLLRCVENCGEKYVEDSTAAKLLETAEEAARAGAHLDIREFAAA
jgi:hypothetical protein